MNKRGTDIHLVSFGNYYINLGQKIESKIQNTKIKDIPKFENER